MSYLPKLKNLISSLAEQNLNYDRFALWYYRRYDHNEVRPNAIARFQDAFTTAYTVMDPSILQGEMIVGKAYRPLNADERKELAGYIATYGKDVLKMQGSADGFNINLDLLVNKGLEWIIYETDKKIAAMEDGDEKDMLKANREGFCSVVRYAHKVSQYVGGVSIKEADPEQKLLKQTVSKMLWRIPQQRAKTFYEAVQSVHFTAFCLTAVPGQVDVVLNGLDVVLAPFLDADLKSGAIDEDTACYVLGNFFAHANFSAFRDQGLKIVLLGDDSNTATRLIKKVKSDLALPEPTIC